MSLLNECILALGESNVILDEDTGNNVFDLFQKDWPFTSWGRINWEEVERKISIDSVGNVENKLSTLVSPVGRETPIYILWDEGSLPVIKADVNSILASIDDVTAVSFDTWLYAPSIGYVIEFYHEGQITLGIQNI